MRKWTIALLVLACSVTAQNARAESNLGLKTAGFQVGFVSPEDIDATLGFGGFADWGTLAPNLHLVSHLDYWSKSEGSPATGEATLRDITLSLRGKYSFPVSSPRFQPFAGAGVGMHFLKAGFEMSGFPAVDDAETRFGIDVGGGFSAPLSPKADLQAEMWYGIVEDFNQLSVKAGMAFKLGQ